MSTLIIDPHNHYKTSKSKHETKYNLLSRFLYFYLEYVHSYIYTYPTKMEKY